MSLLRLLRAAALSLLAALAALTTLTGCDNGGTYRRQGGKWQFDERPIAVADPASFQPLGRWFARDKLRGYYLGSAIEGSDGSRFEALSEHEARDGTQVFWADTYRKGQEYWSIRHLQVLVIEGADPARYQPLRHGYGRDGRSAYFEGRAFAVRDPASFEVLDARFTRDAQRGYFERTEIAGSDGASFALIEPSDGEHARDRRQVFHAAFDTASAADNERPQPRVRVLRGADPASVQLVGRGYARDGARVWWRGQPVAGVDAASFVVVEDRALDHDAQDAGGRFVQGRREAQRQGQRDGVAASSSSSARR